MISVSFLFTAIRMEVTDDNDHLRFASGELHHIIGDSESSIRSYLKSLKNLYNFPLYSYKNGKRDTKHYSFQQIYKEIPVFGRYIRVHINNDIITSFSSNIDTIELSVIPTITGSSAMQIILSDYISTTTYLKYQKLQIYNFWFRDLFFLFLSFEHSKYFISRESRF